ncbi:MAG: DoxX family protein [Dongiaceae bacterium]
MANATMSPSMPLNGIAALFRRALALLERIPFAIAPLLMRIGMGLVFWRSAQTKLANWDTTLLLFREEYRVPVLPPELAAYLATAVELTAPILLAFGLATRLGAGAMLGMTLVIQLFVYPQSYPDHLLWAGPLVYLVLRGPGALSIDHAIQKRFSAAG